MNKRANEAALRLSSMLPKRTHTWQAPPQDNALRQRKFRSKTVGGRSTTPGAAIPGSHNDSVWNEGSVEHFDRFIAGDR